MAQPQHIPQMMRIGELSKRSGKTSRTLHFYEELGLLSPAGRTRGGFRFYSDDALLRIRWIERLQELGFSLQEVATFLSDLNGHEFGPAAMEDLRRFYVGKLRETREALARIQALEGELSSSIDYLEGCRPCDPLTHRASCAECTSPQHAGQSVPPLVAAVHDSP